MNGAYIGIGAALIAIGAVMGARSNKAEDELRARNAKVSAILMALAGVIFIATGVIAGRS